MTTVLLGDPEPAVQSWLERRRALGQDLFDEVWEGVLHVVPAPRLRHGLLDHQVAQRLDPSARRAGLVGSGPANIGLEHDYRVPDHVYHRDPVDAVFVPTAALVVEIVSPRDETYAKLDFYAARGVEELLIVDPERRSVQWYAREGDRMAPRDRSALLDLSGEELAAAIDWPPTE